MQSVCVVLYAHKDEKYPTFNSSSLGELCAASSLCMLRDALLLSLPYSGILEFNRLNLLSRAPRLWEIPSVGHKRVYSRAHMTHTSLSLLVRPGCSLMPDQLATGYLQGADGWGAALSIGWMSSWDFTRVQSPL